MSDGKIRDVRKLLTAEQLQDFLEGGLLHLPNDSEAFIVPQTTEPVYVDSLDGEVVEVVVEGREYRLCELASHLGRYAEEKPNGGYSLGFLNNTEDKRKTERTGILGEVALAKILGTPVDIMYRPGGDVADAFVKGYGIDIKTRAWEPSSREGFIMIENQRSKYLPVPLKADIYLMAYVSEYDRAKSFAIIRIVGGVAKAKLNLDNEAIGKKPGKVGYRAYGKPHEQEGSWHINLYIPYEDLVPIRKILEWARPPENVV